MTEEVWKPIPSYPGYEASSFGAVRSTPAISKSGGYYILSQNLTGSYLGCQLNTKRGRVNRLVCEAFHGPAPSPKHEAAHFDNNELNNREDNLEWQTSKQNKENQPGKQQGVNNPRAKLTELDIKDIRARRLAGEKLDQIHAKYPHVSRSLIAYTYQGKFWKHVV